MVKENSFLGFQKLSYYSSLLNNNIKLLTFVNIQNLIKPEISK